MKFPEELQTFIGEDEPTDRSCHSSAKVFETREGFFIKCDEPGELAREYEITRLFYRLGLGPEPVRYMTTDKDYLVTRKVCGDDLTKDQSDPLSICRIMADALKTLHAQKIGVRALTYKKEEQG